MRDHLVRLRELFSFSKRERPGVILLCLLLVITASLPLLFHGHPKPPDPFLLVRADSFLNAPSAGASTAPADPVRGMSVTGGGSPDRSRSLFRFDPNTLSFSEWEKLGLPQRTIQVILHYRERGGQFRRPEDLGRIWGLPKVEYARLKPYVQIASAKEGVASFPERPPSLAATSPAGSDRRILFQKVHVERTMALDVNGADSLQWLALPGIGERLTSRILRFRERLGGFCTVEQVGETWGLPDSTFQKIRPMLHLQGAVTRKIPLNTAPEEILQQHPYIRYKLAKVIIRYRQEHGPFAAVADLRRIALISDDLYARLEPYCSVN